MYSRPRFHRIIGLMAFLLPVATLSAAAPASPAAGEKAPTVEPGEWFNAKTPVTWAALHGRLILVEKWATWCGPCRQTIPHLNELHQKFAKKGLVIIGVSDESTSKIKPFIDEMKMEYLVAAGGAPDYKTDGIPHGWLVSPKGTIAWEGHPGDLKEAQIEENLKDVKLEPEFKLPKELSGAQRSLESGKLGAGIKELERYLKSPKDDEVARAAQEALDRAKKFGEDQLADATALGKEKEYGAALQILARLEKSFSGHEVAQKAKDQRTEWQKDKDVKLELTAEAERAKARELIAAKKFKEAARILTSLTESKKVKDTKAGQAARKDLEGIRGKF
jgi:thiol-disulfide isomerase/thioredoxin